MARNCWLVNPDCSPFFRNKDLFETLQTNLVHLIRAPYCHHRHPHFYRRRDRDQLVTDSHVRPSLRVDTFDPYLIGLLIRDGNLLD